MKIAALAGGVGGAKLAHGLARILSPTDLTIIVNTADDFVHLGLHISPDLDTVCYTLAGLANARTGWGRANETWHAMDALRRLGGPAWFRLGDKDLATHLERTRLLREGQSLSQVVHAFRSAWKIGPAILPMSDAPVATILHTDEGDLEFQEYFVHRGCRPRVHEITFRGIETARPAPGVVEALTTSDAIIICPSNPWVSIAPILAVPGIRSLVSAARSVAVSPIVGGRALRGPADKMYGEMGIKPSALAVASHYRDIVRGIVVDQQDSDLAADVRSLHMQVLVTNTIMRARGDRLRLARDVLGFVGSDVL